MDYDGIFLWGFSRGNHLVERNDIFIFFGRKLIIINYRVLICPKISRVMENFERL